MALNIAIFIESFDPEAGGAERSTAQIASELAERGHTVTILAGSMPKSVANTRHAFELRAMTTKKSSGVLRLWRFSKWARQQIEQGGFDVTLSVTNAVEADVLQPRGGTVRETLNRNIAMRPHARKRLLKKLTIKLDPKQQLLLHLENKHLKSEKVKTIIAVSDYVKRQLVEGYDVWAKKIQVIANAAVMPVIERQEAAEIRADMRAGLRIADDTTVFAFVAMNPRLKGVATLWRAMEMLKHQGANFVTLMVGSFDFETTAQASQRGLAEQVRILGRLKETDHAYLTADATVLPTFYDPSSKVIIESLMLGRPAITTRFNGACDFLVEGEVRRGEVIEQADDAKALAAAIKRLCDPTIRESYRRNCVGLADRLSMRRHVDTLERVLIDAAGTVQ